MTNDSGTLHHINAGTVHCSAWWSASESCCTRQRGSRARGGLHTTRVQLRAVVFCRVCVSSPRLNELELTAVRLQRANKCFPAVLYRKQQSARYKIKKEAKMNCACRDGRRRRLQWLSLTLGGEAAAPSDAVGVVIVVNLIRKCMRMGSVAIGGEFEGCAGC